MLLSTGWLNREKLVFMACFCVLGLSGVYTYTSRPDFDDPGRHRVAHGAPDTEIVNLDALRPGELENALAGTRHNPFATYVSPVSVVHPKPPGPKPPRPKPPKPPRPPKPPKPPRPPKPPPTRPVPTPTPTTPKPYEVPVNFKGVVGTDDGRLFVLLKTKNSSENRYLSEGDVWPETGLTIVRITRTNVLLQNEKGERFLMRDLYGRRARPEASGAGS
jgi:hypothetical protein